MKLTILPELFGVMRLERPQPFPSWLGETAVFFIAQTEDEYSIICPRHLIPAQHEFDDNWWCIRVEGEMPFDMVGVAAALSQPLADNDISLLLVATHDRDYVLVKDHHLGRVIEIYQKEGFEI